MHLHAVEGSERGLQSGAELADALGSGDPPALITHACDERGKRGATHRPWLPKRAMAPQTPAL